jgi:glutamate-5-semialdehyde dehydrogenase
MAGCSTRRKNDLLYKLADLFQERSFAILEANAKDLEAGRKNGLSQAALDMLFLNEARLLGIAENVRQVALARDPVGEILEGRQLDNGIMLTRARVPLGVLAAVYVAGPDITADLAALGLKSGNAVILRGGPEMAHTNAAMTAVIREALKAESFPADAVQTITDPDETLLAALLRLDRHVDLLIQRGGGAALRDLCREQSRIPVITGIVGRCHIFVDATARELESLEVIANAKIQRPTSCNAVETVLVHRKIAAEFLPRLAAHLGGYGVTLHCSPEAMAHLTGRQNCLPVFKGDYDREWLGPDLNLHVVSGLEEAMSHIREHGSGHSEAILTETGENAEHFAREVDAAAVYVNCSTRFTDGGQFGLGGEASINTGKLHARGPMGLEALTTYKWVGVGNYTTR